MITYLYFILKTTYFYFIMPFKLQLQLTHRTLVKSNWDILSNSASQTLMCMWNEQECINAESNSVSQGQGLSSFLSYKLPVIPGCCPHQKGLQHTWQAAGTWAAHTSPADCSLPFVNVLYSSPSLGEKNTLPSSNLIRMPSIWQALNTCQLNEWHPVWF